MAKSGSGNSSRSRYKSSRNSRSRGGSGQANDLSGIVASLPTVESLSDVPGFSDLRVDETQLAAFDDFCSERASEGVDPSELHVGCVVRLDRGFPLVATETNTLRCEHAVSFAKSTTLLPAAGDWVCVREAPGHDMGVIECVLPRRGSLVRWRGRSRGEKQVLAANVDETLVVQPLGAGREGSPAMLDRIARSLVLAYDCGTEPSVILTKADRCEEDELTDVTCEVRRLVGEDVRIVVSSAATGEGLDEVRSLVPPQTVAMILGESGAGKSSLLNAMLGHEAMATGEVREKDDAGRHTTVARVMIKVPDCGVICDVPGLRSLPLVGHERGLARTFPEIEEKSYECRFNDCTHGDEPGCAVTAAAKAGEIDPMRLEAYRALAEEMRESARSLDPDVTL